MNGDGTSPNQNRHRVSAERFSGRAFQLAIVAGAFLIMLGVVGWIGIADFSRYFDSRDDLIGRLAVNAVVERIIEVESTAIQMPRTAAAVLPELVNSSTKHGSI